MNHKIELFNDESGYRGMACTCGFTSSTGHKMTDHINCNRHLEDMSTQTDTPRSHDAMHAAQWFPATTKVVAYKDAQELERELATASRQAKEIEELRKQAEMDNIRFAEMQAAGIRNEVLLADWIETVEKVDPGVYPNMIRKTLEAVPQIREILEDRKHDLAS